MSMCRAALVCACAALLLAGGCSDSSDQAAAPPGEAAAPEDRGQVEEARQQNLPGVLETFRVGDNVYVRSLAIDTGRNSLWVGTSLGVHEVDLESRDVKATYTRKDGLANEYIFAILVDGQGNKWFGTNGGGITRYREGQWKTYFPMHGLADYWVYAFAEQPDGNLWIGTWAGANFFDPASEAFTTYFDELVNEWVYGVDIDARGRVWLGTEGGISMFDGAAWKSWTHEDGLGAPNREQLPISTNTGLGTRARHDLSVVSEGRPTYNPGYVFSVHVARDDTVWAGTWGGGVSHFANGRWTNFTREDGLAGNIVFSVSEGADGVMWFGTNQGLTRYDGEHWQSYGRANGMSDENIYAIAVAPNGDVWAGSRGEVARIGLK